jgi:prepilin-type N-terminal cleavage/methylation domain-containing protein
MKSSSADRLGGFTLVELLVALAVGGLVIVTAHALLSTTVNTAKRRAAIGESLERRTNGIRWLRAAFRSIEVRSDSVEMGFDGASDRVSFASWLQVPDGWYERERVTIGLNAGRLVATINGQEPILLADSVIRLRFDYLLERGADAPWLTEWHSPAYAPLAVRIRLTRKGVPNSITDTLLLLIGVRG